jgi:hypothetical protein
MVYSDIKSKPKRLIFDINGLRLPKKKPKKLIEDENG